MTWVERLQNEWAALQVAQAELTPPQSQLVGWLSRRRWDVFWTQTFRGKHSPWAALAKWSYCLAEYNSHSTVKAVLYSVEPHERFPSYHVHALLSMKRPLCLTKWRHEYRPWKEHCWRTCGKAVILPCVTATPVWYVIKYVTKKQAPKTWQTGTEEKLWGIWVDDDVPHGV